MLNFMINSIKVQYSTHRCFHVTTKLNFLNRLWLGESKYRSRDKVSKIFELIYKAPMTNYVAVAKHFSTISFVAVTGILIENWFNDWLKLRDDYQEKLTDVLHATETDLIGFIIGLFIVNFMIQFVVTKYPLRIYKHKESYIAIFEGMIPMRSKQVLFKKGDISENFSKGIFPWRHIQYKVNDKRIILLTDYFKIPKDLAIMLEK